LTGRWGLTLTPIDPDAGTAGIPRVDVVNADLIQMDSGGLLNIGRRIWGTLTSADPAFFSSLDIPQLVNNDGSKSGAALGCTLKINIPLAMDVHDDNTVQLPNRLSLSGTVVGKGQLLGDDSSTVIMMDDVNSPSPAERHFSWTGARP
jgi:hypothetical protein